MLNIPETYAQMGKIANNLEKHGEQDVTAFDIPIAGIVLTGEQFNALSEDPYADRWLFNMQGEMREPNLARFEPLTLLDSFEDATVMLKCSDAEFTFAAARVKDVTFEGKRGGDILLSFSVRVRPQNDREITVLLAHQNHEIRIDVADAKIALKGGRNQQELPLSRAGEGEQSDAAADAKPKRGRGRPRKNEQRPH